VRFHTVIFPSCLLGTKDKWTMLHHISTTEYLNYEQGKFSKSRNIGVFGDKAGQIGVSNSVWRYYLLANRPETGDTQFSWHEFILRNNSELLANLGNFVNRVLRFLVAQYDGVLPELPEGMGLRVGPEALEGAAPHSGGEEAAPERGAPLFARVVRDVNTLLSQYAVAMDAVKVRLGLQTMMQISARGNVFLVEAGVDNSLFANSRAECDATMLVAVNLIWVLSALVHPFMPDTADAICAQLNAPPRTVPVEDTTNGKVVPGDQVSSAAANPPKARFSLDLLPGHRIGKPAHLFKPIDAKKEEEWRKQFGGEPSKADAAPTLSKKQAMKQAKAAKKAAPQAPQLKRPTAEWKALDEEMRKQSEVVRKAKETAKKGEEEAATANVDGELAALMRLK
jgi:methionyl-tRNA synthetase